MRTYDFSPLWRSTVGFDRLFDQINNTQQLLENQDGCTPGNKSRPGGAALSLLPRSVDHFNYFSVADDDNVV